MRFIDSHVHLSEYGDQTAWAAFARSSETALLSSGVNQSTSLATLDLARQGNRGPVVKAFVGVHPSETGDGSDLSWFAEALKDATGAGELGLDPKYPGLSTKGGQKTLFTRQLEEVERSGKPVQVHSRGAEKLCLETLGSYRLDAVLMHWFEGEAELGEVQNRGYYVSFGPALLYSKRLQRMAARLDPGRALVESDGPVTFRALGGAGGPQLVPSVVFKLAELWGTSFADAQAITLNSGLSYLGTSGKT